MNCNPYFKLSLENKKSVLTLASTYKKSYTFRNENYISLKPYTETQDSLKESLIKLHEIKITPLLSDVLHSLTNNVIFTNLCLYDMHSIIIINNYDNTILKINNTHRKNDTMNTLLINIDLVYHAAQQILPCQNYISFPLKKNKTGIFDLGFYPDGFCHGICGLGIGLGTGMILCTMLKKSKL